jgi:hypothetical protein
MISNTAGITYISMNAPPDKPGHDCFTDRFIVPDDSNAPELLRTLTSELERFTAELFDIEIVKLSLTWGVNARELPSLITCDGKFKCTSESRPYARFLTDIAFFIALETGQVQEPGACFSGRTECTAPDLPIARQKIETWRIRRLANGLGVDDKAGFVYYVKRRLGVICPALLVTTVLVCRNCFVLYAREKMPTSRDGKELSHSPRPVRGGVVRTSAPAAPNRAGTSVGGYRKSKSGLRYVQDIYGKAVHRATKTYITRPIPAFLQRPV